MKHKKLYNFLFLTCLLLFGGGVLKESNLPKNILPNQTMQSQEASSSTDETTLSLANGSRMIVHYINTGQSDCILIESDKEYMLIDAGEQDDVDNILSYLEKQHIKSLKYLILTHPHADHIGAASQIIDNYNIGKVIMPSKTHTTKTFENVLDSIQKKGLKITKPVVGNSYSLGSASFTIIAPNKKDYGSNLNDYSVGIRLTHGTNRFIFIGDAEVEALEDMMNNGEKLQSDVLLCGHHGSDTSTTKEFLAAVSPKYAIISTGKNSYGHPSKETLSLLDRNHIPYYRTDKYGTILVTSQKNQIQIYADGKRINKSGSDKGQHNNEESLGLNTANSQKTQDNDTSSQKQEQKKDDLPDDATVYITNFGSKYHKKGCKYLTSSAVKTTVKKAKDAGYEPCGSCIK